MATDPRQRQFQKRVGALLASLREQAGMSQEALAVQLRHDQSYLSRIESGARQAGLPFLLTWAAALGVSFTELCGQIAKIWTDQCDL